MNSNDDGHWVLILVALILVAGILIFFFGPGHIQFK